eukprot:2272683-Rhodomonas_salina.1
MSSLICMYPPKLTGGSRKLFSRVNFTAPEIVLPGSGITTISASNGISVCKQATKICVNERSMQRSHSA